MSDGVVDPPQCRVGLTRRTVAHPALLMPNARVYAFRACEDDCTDRGDLVLVFPRTRALLADNIAPELREIGPFSVVSIPYGRGASASIVTEIDKLDVRRFETALFPETPIGGAADAASMVQPSIYLQVELLQGANDASPTITIFSGEGQPQLSRIDFTSPFQAEPPPPLLEQPTPVRKTDCECKQGDPMCSCL